MEFSKKLHTIQTGWFIVCNEGSQVIISKQRKELEIETLMLKRNILFSSLRDFGTSLIPPFKPMLTYPVRLEV